MPPLNEPPGPDADMENGGKPCMKVWMDDGSFTVIDLSNAPDLLAQMTEMKNVLRVGGVIWGNCDDGDFAIIKMDKVQMIKAMNMPEGWRDDAP